MIKILKILQLIIIVSRPILWLATILLFLIGFNYGKGVFDYTVILQLFGFTLPGCLMLFGLNDIFDYPSDLINPRKQSKFDKVLQPEYHSLILILAFFGGFYLFLTSLLVNNNENLFLVLCILFLGFAYSVPPLRFKTKPFLEILTNILGIVLVFVIGYSHTNSVLILFQTLNPKIWLTIIFCLAGTAVFAFLVDFDSDKAVGDHNLVTLLGKKTSLTLLNFLYLISVLLILDKTVILIGVFSIWLLTLSLWFFWEEKIWQKLYHLHLFIIILTLFVFLILKIRN